MPETAWTSVPSSTSREETPSASLIGRDSDPSPSGWPLNFRVVVKIVSLSTVCVLLSRRDSMAATFHAVQSSSGGSIGSTGDLNDPNSPSNSLEEEDEDYSDDEEDEIGGGGAASAIDMILAGLGLQQYIKIFRYG